MVFVTADVCLTLSSSLLIVPSFSSSASCSGSDVISRSVILTDSYVLKHLTSDEGTLLLTSRAACMAPRDSARSLNMNLCAGMTTSSAIRMKPATPITTDQDQWKDARTTRNMCLPWPTRCIMFGSGGSAYQRPLSRSSIWAHFRFKGGRKVQICCVSTE